MLFLWISLIASTPLNLNLALAAPPACTSDEPISLMNIRSTTGALHQNLDPTSEQIRRMEQITSAFENSSTDFQYDYIENLNDGRGYTAGRVGFCSGTGDMLEVLEIYAKLKPSNSLNKFLPEMHHLDKVFGKPGAADVKELDKLGFVKAWREAAKDPIFRQAQDDEVKRTYLKPAIDSAQTLGLKTPLSIGFLYDTVIQHGNGTDPDGMQTLIAHTTRIMHGTPASGVDEKLWIAEMMKLRHADLAHAVDAATRKEWSTSVDRVNCYQRILATQNYNLDGPIHFTVFGGSFTIP